MRPGVWQLVIVVLIIILLFGARRLPDLARSMGQSLKIFKHEVKDLHDDTPRAVESRPQDDPAAHPTAADGAAADGATPAVTEYPARQHGAGEHRTPEGDRGSTA